MGQKKTNTERWGVNRRGVLKGVGATAVVLGFPVARGGATQAESERNDEAMICDVDMDMAFSNEMHLDGDPADGDRENVVHVTSNGEETTDYVCSTVDLTDLGLTLGDVRSSGSLTYDYFAGPDHAHAAPDEVFLVLRDGDGNFFVVYQHRDAGRPAEQWNTRDVSAEIGGSGPGWHAFQVDPETIDVENEMARTTNEVIVEAIVQLRDSATFDSVVEQFGEGTELLAASVGAGWTTQATVTDLYFDDLVVGDETFELPAVVAMNASFNPTTFTPSTSSLHARLQFTDADAGEVGLSLEDIDPTMVRLSIYSPIAPPVAGTNVDQEATIGSTERRLSGEVTSEGIRIDFAPGSAARLVEAGSPVVVLVHGEFAGDVPRSFLATTEIELEG